jgi:hypothetical protein
MRRLALFLIAAAATGLVAGVMIVGCGDSGSSNQEVTAPELKPPPGGITGTSTDEGATGDKGTTGDQSTTTTPSQSTGGSQAPAGGQTGGNPSGGANAPDDTKQKDTPPPQGSPAERFEQFCSDNPGAC